MAAEPYSVPELPGYPGKTARHTDNTFLSFPSITLLNQSCMSGLQVGYTNKAIRPAPLKKPNLEQHFSVEGYIGQKGAIDENLNGRL